MGSLRKKLSHNLYGYSYSQAVTLATQIAVVPFFLSAWGLEKYGEWLVLTGVPMFLALMELGVAQASSTRATQASGRDDLPAVRKSLDTAMAFSVAAALCVVLLGSGVALTLQWESLLGLKSFDADTARTVFICMSLYLAANFLAGPVNAWLKAVDCTAVGAFWMAHRRAAEVIVTIAALSIGSGPTELAVSLALTSSVSTSVFYLVALRYSTVGAITFSQASFGELRAVIWPAVSFMTQPLAQAVTLQGGVLVLNALAGSAVVAAFTMARTMVRLLMQVGVVLNNSMRPEVSRLLGQGQFDKALRIVKRGSLTAYAIALAGLVGVAVLGPEVLKVWSGEKVVMTAPFLVLLAAHAVANVFWFAPSTLIFAENRHGLISWSYMCFSISAVVIWWGLAHFVQPQTGAALMMLAPEILMIIIVYFSTFRSEKKVGAASEINSPREVC